MTDFIKSNTGIKTLQIVEPGTTNVIETNFMLTDLLVETNSIGQVTIMAADDEHTHVIAVIRDGRKVFNHAFEGGWMFWKGAKLKVAKETEDGEVNIAVGAVHTPQSPDYNQWTRRIL